MWKHGINECYLKDTYSSEHLTKCKDCVMYSREGRHYVYPVDRKPTPKPASRVKEKLPPSLSRDEARIQCRVSAGYDQSREYDLPGMPIKYDYAYLCCNACAARKGKNNQKRCNWTACALDCESWVWHFTSHLCYLKSEYDSTKLTPCKDCEAFDKSTTRFVFEAKPVTKVIEWTETEFGEGTGWAKVPEEGTSHRCTFDRGFDQTHEYDLGEPYMYDDAYKCCQKCHVTEGHSSHLTFPNSRPLTGCESWVWNIKTKKCQLKDTYFYEDARTIECPDCIAFHPTGKHYLYKLTAEVIHGKEIHEETRHPPYRPRVRAKGRRPPPGTSRVGGPGTRRVPPGGGRIVRKPPPSVPPEPPVIPPVAPPEPPVIEPPVIKPPPGLKPSITAIIKPRQPHPLHCPKCEPAKVHITKEDCEKFIGVEHHKDVCRYRTGYELHGEDVLDEPLYVDGEGSCCRICMLTPGNTAGVFHS